MKVAIDVSPLKNANRYRGVGIYTQQLVKSLQSLNISNFSCQLIEDKTMVKDSDLIHYPFFDLFFLTLPLKKPKPTVVTIHDVIPLIFPEHYPAGIRGSLKFQTQKFSLKGVKAVITDSENSRKDIFKYLNYPKNKIYVVPLAPGKEFRPITNHQSLTTIKHKYQLPETFVLYVGDVNYNKNIIGFIKAFKKLNTSDGDRPSLRGHDSSEVRLVLIGKAFTDENLKETKEIIQLINSLKLSKKVIRLGWVPNKDLVALYNLASVYCQPSFYEGFGLPVLEAMACGCPVVAAKTSSLPEICGSAAIMVDPYNLDDMIKGLKKALVKQEELRDKGFQQVKKFSWGKTAQKTYEIYQKVV